MIDFPPLPNLFADNKQELLAKWYYSLKEVLQRNSGTTENLSSQDATSITTMPTTKRVLAQCSPERMVLSTLFSVSPNTQVQDGKIIVANRGKTTATFRVSIAPNGAPDNVKQYLMYDVEISANNSRGAESVGIDLVARDEVRVYSSNGEISFSLSGSLEDII